ncbi:hypothetical protein MAXJ12_31342 [Mesorhizobium alhagi CCNWXJ12-2]|uniref:Uncharacterized protein n=1 Tax=Mesorhizobium alhagi CCNWXJ12-2 TaxID=1107882 RepID=H0I1D1_9HYPH|nr:hypothetical protein MAXJ12_31342 [Mesorhizobium alhagi CCNWXJ12-2]
MSQVSSATTGQVASDEPRPISTSRQPVSKRHQQVLVQNLHPAAAIFGLVAADVQPDDLGTPEATGETDEQHGAVAQAAQGSAIERLQHGDEVLGQHRLLLPGRGGAFVADTGHYGGDMAVLPVERLAAANSSTSAGTGGARSSTPNSASILPSATCLVSAAGTPPTV